MRRRRILLTGGLVAIAVAGTATAVKMIQRDAQRIEAHTGKKPEDLSEEQLEAAINDLDIETQELTDADVSAIEAAGPEEATPSAPAAPAPVVPATPTAPSPPAQADYITELKRLAELRDMGIITPEDFEAKKKQLLGI
jgi:hypothetical protein